MFRYIRTSLALALLLSLIVPAGSMQARHLIAGEEDLAWESGTVTYYESYITATKAASALEEAAGSAPEAVAYVVNSGDTLYKIASSFGSSVSALQAYNQIANANSLQVGQKLMIPSVPQDVPLLAGKEPVIEKVLTSTLTAYTAGKESTGKTPSHPQYGITYSGVVAEEGRTVAVDPKVIPLGSTVYIEGIGIRKAEDTGSAIKGSKIDVFMNDVGEARTFGVKRNVKVFVLSEA
jgi:3D (Asp-Asp-Asp) domain-containing protein